MFINTENSNFLLFLLEPISAREKGDLKNKTKQLINHSILSDHN